MKKSLLLLFVILSFAPAAYAQDTDEPVSVGNDSIDNESTGNELDQTEASATEETLAEASPAKPGGPKTMSGMSILGNEETPKSLVIVPWKSSEMGDELDLSDTLDDRAQPVDKEVFLRELTFYEIRSGEQK
jgi:hypothetical protein